MSWVKLDDHFFRNPKIIEAGRDARDLYLAGLCYSASALTDGFISASALPILAADAGVSRGATLAARLVTAGLWDAVPTGYRIRDWLKCRIIQGNDSPARRVWDRLRRRIGPLVLARDGYRCQYCGATQGLTVDHILPLSRGGGNEMANLATACSPCNSAKRTRTPEEWLT